MNDIKYHWNEVLGTMKLAVSDVAPSRDAATVLSVYERDAMVDARRDCVVHVKPGTAIFIALDTSDRHYNLHIVHKD